MTAGDYDAAVSAFSQVLAVDPGNSQATEGLSEARRNIDRARSAALKGRLADAEQKLSDGAYDEAISIFEGILKTDATNPDALDGASRARRAKAAEDAIIRTRAKKPSGSE
jgi:tetratricopeptide (TPR) repeat protein